MKQYPPIQLVNDNDEPVGSGSLQDIYGQGLLHRVVMVSVWDPDGKLLLQRRSPQVATNANRWDISAAGHVDADETYEEAAQKELSEELGVDNTELVEAAHYRTYSVVEGHKLNRFIKIYRTTIPADTRLTISPEEVTEVRWFSLDELRELISRQPEEFNDDFNEVLAKIQTK